MDRNNKILDDVTKLFGDGLASLGNLKCEIDKFIKSALEGYLSKMDLVSRKEYQILHDMVSKMRIEQEELKKQLSQQNKDL